jgi:hypothetical protein
VSKTLHLLIPGLLGPWPQITDYPRVTALVKLLGRATVQALTVSGFEATLFALFGYDENQHQQRDLPVAAATYLADQGGNGADQGGNGTDTPAADRGEPRWWLRADPVHLRADLHHVRLFDARTLDIEPHEATTLVAAINGTLSSASAGWVLEAPRPERWYLRLNEDPAITTWPLTGVSGRDIQTLLPRGRGAQNWHALLTEIQMLLHEHDINIQRELAGRPIINSVWLWGAGRLDAKLCSPAAEIYANDPLTRGLARAARQPVSWLPDTAAGLLDSSGAAASSLLVIDSLRYGVIDRDFQHWSGQLKQLEGDWFEACTQWLKNRQIEALIIYPGNGSKYVVTPSAIRRFWRSSRALSHYIDQ